MRKVHFFLSNFVLSKFRKNDLRKNVQSRPIFEQTNFFFRNEFRKNDRRISKERYSIKRPSPIETMSIQFEIPQAYLKQQTDVPPPTTMAMMIISKQSQQRHTNRLHAVDPQGSWPRGLRSTLIYPTKEYSTIDILMDGYYFYKSDFLGCHLKRKL